MMPTIQKLAIAVDLSKMDEKLLAYTQYMLDWFTVKEVQILHVVPGFFPPTSTVEKGELVVNASHDLKEKIKHRILETIPGDFLKRVSVDVKILEGNPYEELKQFLSNEDIDLLILGRKNKTEGSGIVAQKIIRDFSEKILFLSENATKEIQQMIVPVDFSDEAAKAVKLALALSEKIENSTVRCVHVVHHMLEASTGISQAAKNELAAQSYLDTINAWQDFLKQHELLEKEITIEYLQDKNSDTAGLLLSFFENQETDLIVMGTKTHTPFEKFAFGSVTEDLLNQCDHYPILII